MKKAAGSSLPRAYSSQVVDGADRAASRAMMHAVGFSTDDFRVSQVGIASTRHIVTPCSLHIAKLAVEAAVVVNEAGGKSLIYDKIIYFNGLSKGTVGLIYSLIAP